MLCCHHLPILGPYDMLRCYHLPIPGPYDMTTGSELLVRQLLARQLLVRQLLVRQLLLLQLLVALVRERLNKHLNQDRKLPEKKKSESSIRWIHTSSQ